MTASVTTTTSGGFNNEPFNCNKTRNFCNRLRSCLTLDIITNPSGVGLERLSDILGVGIGGATCDEDNGVLSTPDVGMLKLATPELDRLVLQQHPRLLEADHTANEGENCSTSCPSPVPNKPVAHFTSENCDLSISKLLSNEINRPSKCASARFDSSGGATVTENAVEDRWRSIPAQPAEDALTEILSDNSTCGFESACSRPPSSLVAAQTSLTSFQTATQSTTSHYSRHLHPVSVVTSFSESADTCDWYPSAVKRQRCSGKGFDDVDYGKCSASTFDFTSDQLASMASSAISMSGVETPPISPIDMVEQERIKLERKRARNRVAATRCRNRKLERIAVLQEQADQLRITNTRLTSEVQMLRQTVYQLRLDMNRHSLAGCQPNVVDTDCLLPVYRRPQFW